MLTLFFIFFVQNANFYDEIKFKHFNVSDGLSQSTVYDIHQDKYGYLWIGTQGGLNRFDGNEFKHFQNIPYDTLSLSNNYVVRIEEDHKGNLWLLTATGITEFNLLTESFTELKITDNLNIINIQFFYESLYISTTTGLYIYDINLKKLSGNIFENVKNKRKYDNVIFKVHFDRYDEMWIGTQNGFFKFNKEKNLFEKIFTSDNSLHTMPIGNIFEDSDGNFWLSYLFNRVYHYNQETEEKTRIDFPQDVKLNNLVTDFEEINGKIWVATDNHGLFIVDKQTKTFQNLKKSFVKDFTLKTNNITRLEKDNRGTIWIGTNNLGLSSYNSYTMPFKSISYAPHSNGSLKNSIVWSIFAEKEKIWIGTDAGTIEVFQEKKEKKLYKIKIKSRFSAIYGINRAPNGKIYAATYEKIFEFDEKKDKFVPIKEKKLQNIFQASQLKNFDGKLWTFSQGIFFIYDFDSKNLEKHSVGIRKINWILPQKNNNDETEVWIGTEFNGLILFNLKTKSKRHWKYNVHNKNYSISSNAVYSIHEDKHGHIWVGTNSGIDIINKKTGEVFHNHKKDGISNEIIYSILEDNFGKIWFSTNHGLIMASHNKPNAIKFFNFFQDNGLSNIEYNQAACFKSETGELYFGGTKGVDIINPKKIIHNPYRPKIIINEIKYANNSLRFPDDNSVINIEDPRSNIEIHYIAPDLTKSEPITYKYKLEGFDEEWQFAGKENYVRYMNLPSGEYTFRVSTTNPYGAWNSSEKSFKIIVPPSFWKTPLFLIIMFLLLVSSIYIYRAKEIRIRRLLEIRIQSRTLQLRERNRSLRFANRQIAKQKEKLSDAFEKLQNEKELKESMIEMIVHDIKNPLNTVISLTEPEHIVSNKNRNHIHQAAYQILNLVINLLETQKFDHGDFKITKEIVSLNKLTKDAIEQVSIIASQKHIDIDVNYQEDYQILADSDILTRVFVNLLSNAIKYSPFGETVVIDAKTENKKINISIIDTGSGIPENQQKSIFERYVSVNSKNEGIIRASGIGLNFCKIAVEAHENEIFVQSSSQYGTIFTFTMDLVSKKKKKEEIKTQEENTFYSESSIKTLQPTLEKIRNLDIYDTSDIVARIKSLRQLNNEEINKFCDELEDAVFFVEEKTYKSLIDRVLNI